MILAQIKLQITYKTKHKNVCRHMHVQGVKYVTAPELRHHRY